MNLHRGDLVGGLVAGLLTGLGIGLLLAPQRGRAASVLQQSERGQRLGEAIGEAGPLVFELGLVALAQVRPVLGRLAWAIVHLAGRTRSK